MCLQESETDARTRGAMIAELSTLDAVYAALETNAARLVVLYFYQNACGNCIKASPSIEKSARSGVLIFKVNRLENVAAASRFDIVEAPRFVFVRNGLVVERQKGFAESEFDRAVRTHGA